jgi:hypothetical protein
MNYATAAAFLISCILIGNSLPVYCQAASEQGTQTAQSSEASAELRGLLPEKPGEKVPEDSQSTSNVTVSVAINVEQDYIPIDHIRGLVVKITNQSKHPVLINCDDAKVVLSPNQVASLRDLELVEDPPLEFKALVKEDAKETLVAGITVGAVPAIDGIKLQHAPILQRYGKDEERRENEMQRFGKRLLWPGEINSGTIFFRTDAPLMGSTLEVPVSLPFSGTSSAQATQIISTRVQY